MTDAELRQPAELFGQNSVKWKDGLLLGCALDRENTLSEAIEQNQASVYSHRYTTLKALQPPPISVIAHYSLL